MEKKAYQLSITGKVQGVFFRKSTQQKAQSLGVIGWVRNEADGSVTAEIQGDEKNLKQLIEWCYEGPPEAVVDEVKVTSTPLKEYQSFEILR